MPEQVRWYELTGAREGAAARCEGSSCAVARVHGRKFSVRLMCPQPDCEIEDQDAELTEGLRAVISGQRSDSRYRWRQVPASVAGALEAASAKRSKECFPWEASTAPHNGGVALPSPAQVKVDMKGVSLKQMARMWGVSEGLLQRYCRRGQLIGARKHPLTKKWWIYPPAHLVTRFGR